MSTVMPGAQSGTKNMSGGRKLERSRTLTPLPGIVKGLRAVFFSKELTQKRPLQHSVFETGFSLSTVPPLRAPLPNQSAIAQMVPRQPKSTSSDPPDSCNLSSSALTGSRRLGSLFGR